MYRVWYSQCHPLEHVAKGLRHVCLAQGAKYYGARSSAAGRLVGLPAPA